MLFFDADNDKDIDVLCQNSLTSGTGITWMENIGIGAFLTHNAVSGTFNDGPFNGIAFTHIDKSSSIALYPVDYGNDGDLDLVEQTSLGAGRILRNDNGSYTVAGSNPLPGIIAANRMLFFDADSDGDVDVLYQSSTSAGTGISYLENIGFGVFITHNANVGGTFTSGPFNGITISQVGAGSALLFPVDYDDDGDFDLVEQSMFASRLISQSGRPPYVTTKNPAHQSTGMLPANNIVLTFNEPVTTEVGNIYIRKLSDGSIVQTISAISANVTGSGTNTITIDPPADLSAGTAYYLAIAEGALRDANNATLGVADPVTSVMEPFTGSDFLSFTTAASLPVVLIDFTARRNSEQVQLSWKTSAETDNNYFIVERSADGHQFEEIGRVTGKQNSSILEQYTYVDAAPLNGVNHYRLTQVDLNGRQEVLGLRSVRMQGAVVWRAYPNPAQDQVTLTFKGILPVAGELQVTNALGIVLKRIVIPAGSGRYMLPVSGLAAGAYWLRLKTDGSQSDQLLMIAR